jgi:hypothetical protein
MLCRLYEDVGEEPALGKRGPDEAMFTFPWETLAPNWASAKTSSFNLRA